MYELRCGHLRYSNRSCKLHELHDGRILNISRGLNIVDVYRLCRGQLRCEHGIDVMRIMQHRNIRSSERKRMYELWSRNI